MKLAITYIFPESGGNGHLEKAIRFIHSYHSNPPMLEHDTVIICNGGKATDESRFLFESLPNLHLIEHDDSGFDIGGYQKAAATHPCDMMVFLGGNSYFRGAGWLARMKQVFVDYGDNLYGCTGNQGDGRFNVFPHVRTTGFWCSPKLINEHPLRCTHNGLRYPYEHGRDGLTTWVLRKNKRALIVGWDCMYDIHNCDQMPGGYHNGTQHNVLVGDRLTMPPYYPHE